MLYDKEDLYNQSLKAIKENNLISIEDIVAFLPCVKSTFYEYFPADSDESNALKKELNDNKIRLKAKLRKKWEDSDNATLQISLYKLIAEEEERQKLSQSYQNVDHTTKGESMNVISLGRGINPEEDGTTS